MVKKEKLLILIPIFSLALSVFSAGLILYFILKYGVDVPYNDQWNYAEFFVHYFDGTLTFEELFRLQNEYRQFFPNIIFLGLGLLTDWNVKYEMFVVFLLACLTSYNILRLSFFTLKGNKWMSWVLFFIANLFIFSPMQYENWLFGVQIQYLLPMACISSCLLLALTKTNKYVALIVCILLSLISSYSTPNGFLCWLLTFPVLLIRSPQKSFFRKWPVVLIWLMGIALTLFFYFFDYKNPPDYPSTYSIFEHPIDAIKYFFALLGNPIRIVHSLQHITAVGGVVFFIFILILIYLFYHRKDKLLIQNSIVWLMLATYSLVSAGLVTIGRLGFGLYQSLSSRYTSYTLYLIVAGIFLLALIIRHYKINTRFVIYRNIFLAIFIVYIISVKIDTYPVAVSDLKIFHSRIQHGKAGLLFINHFPHQECENKIYPYNPRQLWCWANLLNDLGYLRPALLKTDVIQDIEGEESGEVTYGSLDKIERLQGNEFKAYGTAMMPDNKRPADAVLLSFDNYKGKSLLLDLYNGDSINWTKTFSLGMVPYDTVTISAWAFDANNAKAYRLHGNYKLAKIVY